MTFSFPENIISSLNRILEIIKTIINNLNQEGNSIRIILLNQVKLSKQELNMLNSLFESLNGNFFNISSSNFDYVGWPNEINLNDLSKSSLSFSLTGEPGSSYFIYEKENLENKVRYKCFLYDIKSKKKNLVLNLGRQTLVLLSGLIIAPWIGKENQILGIYFESSTLERDNLKYVLTYLSKIKRDKPLYLIINCNDLHIDDLFDSKSYDLIFFEQEYQSFQLLPFDKVRKSFIFDEKNEDQLVLFLGNGLREKKSIDLEIEILKLFLSASSIRSEKKQEFLDLLDKRVDLNENIPISLKILNIDGTPLISANQLIMKKINLLNSLNKENLKKIIKFYTSKRIKGIITNTLESSFNQIFTELGINTIEVKNSKEWKNFNLNNAQSNIPIFSLYGNYSDPFSLKEITENKNYEIEIRNRTEILAEFISNLAKHYNSSINCLFIMYSFANDESIMIQKLMNDYLISPYFIYSLDNITKSNLSFLLKILPQNISDLLLKSNIFINSLNTLKLTLVNKSSVEFLYENLEILSESIKKETRVTNFLSLSVFEKEIQKKWKDFDFTKLSKVPKNRDELILNFATIFRLWDDNEFTWLKDLLNDKFDVSTLKEYWDSGNINLLESYLKLELSEMKDEIEKSFLILKNLRNIRNLEPIHDNEDFEKRFKKIGIEYFSKSNDYLNIWLYSINLYNTFILNLNEYLRSVIINKLHI